MKHTIKVAFTFVADVEVEAETVEQAESVVLENFSCVGPSFQDGAIEKIVSWDAMVQPEKHILRGVDCVGRIQSDGSYKSNMSRMWQNCFALKSKAANAEDAGNLAFLGIQILEVFSKYDKVTKILIETSEDNEYDDQGGTNRVYNTSVNVEANDDEQGDETDTDVIAEELEQIIGDDGLGETINNWAVRNGQLLVMRDDVQPFLGVPTVSGLEVIKHLGSLPESSFEEHVSKLENIHI